MATRPPFPTSDTSKTTPLRVPPQSVEAEQAVLGGLMLDNSAWDLIADRLSPDDFYRQDHRLIYTAIGSLRERDDPCDAVTIAEHLESRGELEDVGGLAYLGALAKDTPSAANIAAYAGIVRERSILRQLIDVGTDIANNAFQPEGRDSKDILDAAEQAVFEIADSGMRHRAGFVRLKDILGSAVDRIDALYNMDGSVTGVATGFNDFDRETSGLQPGDLIIVAGRPSMGKTAFAMNVAEHAALKHNKPVLCFSMEMSSEQLAMRLISSHGRINQQKLRTGDLSDEDWPRVTSAVALLADTQIFIDDTPALSPNDIRARARRMKREHGLEMIIVDYLQLMQVPSSRENRATEISEISRNLKALAKELKVPVMALSQLNRALESRPDKRPRMADLRECVTGDTLVVLRGGNRVPIGDLVGQKPEVVSIDENQKIVHAKSDRVWKTGRRPVYRVSLASGRQIRATAEHRLLAGDGWKTISRLDVGDRLAVSRFLPEPGEARDWPEARLALLAHLIGDGSYLVHQPMRYTTASEENSEVVTNAAREEFGATVKRYAGRGNWHQLVISGNGNRWHPKGVNLWLRQLGIYGQRSHDKRVPETVFELGNRSLAIFLRHLWATDGSNTVSEGRGRVHFSTASEGLARDVAALLLRFGIVARTKRVTQRESVWFGVHISGAEHQKLFLDRIGAFGPHESGAAALAKCLKTVKSNTNVDTLPQEVFQRVRIAMAESGMTQRAMAAARGTSYGGTSHFRFAPSREVLADYGNLLDDPELKKWAESDLFWDRVVGIVPDGEEDVFDLTVPGPASWLADGVVSHNSGALEQDADVIIFIYRDEVYNEDTPHKGKAEIIIAKQRNGPIGTTLLTFLGQYTRFENYSAEPYGGTLEQ